jgi:hypothetical protein
MKISKEQREAIARTLDTLATSSVIGGVVGYTGHTVVSTAELVLLGVSAVILYVLGFLLRS